ncbi:glycine cleavage system protein H [Streptomyces sp. NPDC001480]|uniref:glycine cleavage system protein H n=1 Tax=Streptomyces sp. NPDC001480 TaxID=3364577 RepID=UPI00369C1429
MTLCYLSITPQSSLVKSDVPAGLKYTDGHEWVHAEADGTRTIGITDYAQKQLGDIVFLELPQARSNRSRFITLFHAATKSRTNFSPASWDA